MSSIEIKGLDRILANIDGFTAELDSKMDDATKFVENIAKQKAPKDTGRLIGSIESEVERQGNTIIGTVFTPVEYAPYQEYGTGLFAVNGDGRKTPWAYEDPKTGEKVFTRGNRPHPFMGPALRENKDTILQFFKEGLK